MKLHIFNPEHDIALANHRKRFTPPRAARLLRHDCGFLPALWADVGDLVLVDDVVLAEKALLHYENIVRKARFVTIDDLKRLYHEELQLEVEPWGWDLSVCDQLKRAGTAEWLLMDDGRLETVRTLSNRKFSSEVLTRLREAFDTSESLLVGESWYADSMEEVRRLLSLNKKSVLKEPWSCSGRGVRMTDGLPDEALSNWILRVIRQQGGIMVEPYYNKVTDFGMEFSADDDKVCYRGLSLFRTENSFYTGNVIATEETKRAELLRFVPDSLLVAVQKRIESELTPVLHGVYQGPLGVDMMVVEPESDRSEYRLHPMVEINLRRTMGHVAIDLADRIALPNNQILLMRLAFDGGQYYLDIK